MVMSKIVTIHERTVGSSLSSIKQESGGAPIIPGVKVLGVESKNGRRYPLEVMEKSLQKYEGAIVNIDHPAGSEPRKYEDRFGRLTNCRLESDGIYADLSYNPKHPLAEGFEWWVKNDPKAIGLSHNAQAKTKMNEQDNIEEIEEIVQVDSVDLVAEPATTSGLMECVVKAKRISERCWDGYEPTPGKEPYSKGSCKKETTKGFKKGNRMNVKESLNAIEKVISDFQKNIGKAFYDSCKAVPRTGVPKEWHSSLDHGLTASSSPWYGVINEAEKIAKKMYKEYVDRVEDHRAEAKKRGMAESKPTKKLNVTEAKKRRNLESVAIRRKLVAEAIMTILKKKGQGA
jgi:hypothetical protein